jgi:hypothetical protein
MVTFDRPVASGVSVLQEWMTFDVAASDGDPATPTGMPSGLLYNTFGDSLTWVPYTYDANNYNWKVNNEITVTISDHVKDATGAELIYNW